MSEHFSTHESCKYLAKNILQTPPTLYSPLNKEIVEPCPNMVVGYVTGRTAISAKYGCYTFLEMKAHVIIDTRLVQSNEVGGSVRMEKEGFLRSLDFIEKQGMTIGKIITDRHVMIRKWMRENRPNSQYLFDIWHIAKGLKKKLRALAKEKDCEKLGLWISSIINHLYWFVILSAPGETEVVAAKWQSLLNHLVNIQNHNNPHFPKCVHKRLRGREARLKWLDPGSKLYTKLEGILQTKLLLKDLKQTSGTEQTSSIETFHSLLNHYAPETYAFSYDGLLCRIYIAIMHFNENIGRLQKQTREGEKRYVLTYPKWKGGGHNVRKILEEPTFKVLLLCTQNPDDGDDVTECMAAPPTLSSHVTRPDTQEAVREHLSRYK